VALNAHVDLEPFSRIDPCGYPGLASTSLAMLGVGDRIDAVQQRLGDAIERAVAPATGTAAMGRGPISSA
jgi:lipoyl(octanoyl) transferase